MRRLTAEDYAVDAVTAAKALVGAWLCRRLEDGSVVRRRITETEAYCGEEDTACHAHKGRTARTDVMYSPGGCAYIYLCYGMHEMLNVVTGPEGRPEAVLVRGVEGAEGPGRLTKLLKIDRSLNREDLVHSNRLWLESDGLQSSSPPSWGNGCFRLAGIENGVGIMFAGLRTWMLVDWDGKFFPMMDIF